MAQALPLLAAPLLTRLCTPAAFGELAMFVAVTSVGAVLVTGRYELAILLPRDDEDAAHVAALACLCATLGTAAVILLVAVVSLTGLASSATWIPLIAPMILMLSIHQVLNYWYNRRAEYAVMAKNRIWRAAATAVAMLVFARFDVRHSLILGTIAGQALGTVLFIGRSHARREFSAIRIARLAVLGRRYRGFLRYSVPGDVINACSSQMPTFVLSAFFPASVVGFFSLSQRVCAGPTALAASAIGDVFRQRASEEMQAYGTCRATWTQTFRLLLLLSIPPYVLLAVSAPKLFSIVFGAEWAEAGRYAQVLSPFFLLSFSGSILGRTTSIAERLREDMIWQVVLFFLLAIALFGGAWISDATVALGLYSAAYSSMYLVYLAMTYHYSRGGNVRVVAVEAV